MSLLCSLRVSLCRVRHCPVAYHCMVQKYPHLLLRGAVRTKVIFNPLPHHVRVQTYSTVTILSNSRLIRVRMWCIILYHHTFIILPLLGGNKCRHMFHVRGLLVEKGLLLCSPSPLPLHACAKRSTSAFTVHIHSFEYFLIERICFVVLFPRPPFPNGMQAVGV